jgi:hypothetical protein
MPIRAGADGIAQRREGDLDGPKSKIAEHIRHARTADLTV